jgi:cysteine synthase
MLDALRNGALALPLATAVAWLAARDRRLAVAVGGSTAATVAAATLLAARRRRPSLLAPFGVDR